MNGSVIWKQRLDDLIGGLSSRNAYVDEEILGNGNLCDVPLESGKRTVVSNWRSRPPYLNYAQALDCQVVICLGYNFITNYRPI